MTTHNKNHTPGPWEINGSFIVKDCYGKVICETDVSMYHPPKRLGVDEVWANTRLIAAAPDLLNALETALTLLHDVYNKDTPTIQGLRVAVAKARGQ